MANKNDKAILELKKKVDLKKKEISKIKRFDPITNCSLTINDKRFNLHTLDEQTLIHLIVVLNSSRMSAVDIGLLDKYKLCGYPLISWISDIQQRLIYLEKVAKEKELKAMETRLQALLSEDKRIELELEDLANTLGN